MADEHTRRVREIDERARPFDGPNTELGRAIGELRNALACLGHYPITSAELAEGYTLVRWALDNLLSVDAADVDRWLTEEQCAACGSSEVACLDDHGAPYCAACWPREVERQARLDDDEAAYRAAQFATSDREGTA